MKGQLSLVSVTEDVDPVEGLLAELVQRVHAGDEQAFEELYHHTVDRVFGLVRRMLASPADAEEVTEDVYVYLWKHAGRFDRDRGTVMSWLFTLAHSRAIDRLRALRRQARTGQALAAEPAELEAAEDALEALAGARLHEMIAALPETQRQVLTLAYFRGLSHQEIANALTLSLGTVKTHLRRTLMTLRDTVTP